MEQQHLTPLKMTIAAVIALSGWSLARFEAASDPSEQTSISCFATEFKSAVESRQRLYDIESGSRLSITSDRLNFPLRVFDFNYTTGRITIEADDGNRYALRKFDVVLSGPDCKLPPKKLATIRCREILVAAGPGVTPENCDRPNEPDSEE